MISSSSISIDAPADLVWEVFFTDVEHWPDWTASVTTLRGLDGAQLAVGRRFEIKQPRMPKLVWTVTELEPGTSWTWVQRSPGGGDVGASRRRAGSRWHDGPPGTQPGRRHRIARGCSDATDDTALSDDGAHGLKAHSESLRKLRARTPDLLRRRELLDALVAECAENGVGGRSLRELAEAVGDQPSNAVAPLRFP